MDTTTTNSFSNFTDKLYTGGIALIVTVVLALIAVYLIKNYVPRAFSYGDASSITFSVIGGISGISAFFVATAFVNAILALIVTAVMVYFIATNW